MTTTCPAPVKTVRRLLTEQKRTTAPSESETAAVARLERRIVDLVDHERAALARALHDTVSQSLSGSFLLLRVLGSKLKQMGQELPPEMAELGAASMQAGKDIHLIERWLRSPSVEDATLGSALAELAASISQTVPCELHCPEPVIIADRFVVKQLVLIAHEAARRAIVPASAQRVAISLLVENEEISMAVRQDGTADDLIFDDSIRELLQLRAKVIGARLTIATLPEGGVQILCKLPKAK